MGQIGMHRAVMLRKKIAAIISYSLISHGRNVWIAPICMVLNSEFLQMVVCWNLGCPFSVTIWYSLQLCDTHELHTKNLIFSLIQRQIDDTEADIEKVRRTLGVSDSSKNASGSASSHSEYIKNWVSPVKDNVYLKFLTFHSVRMQQMHWYYVYHHSIFSPRNVPFS